jgi:hypothetical protein
MKQSLHRNGTKESSQIVKQTHNTRHLSSHPACTRRERRRRKKETAIRIEENKREENRKEKSEEDPEIENKRRQSTNNTANMNKQEGTMQNDQGQPSLNPHSDSRLPFVFAGVFPCSPSFPLLSISCVLA